MKHFLIDDAPGHRTLISPNASLDTPGDSIWVPTPEELLAGTRHQRA